MELYIDGRRSPEAYFWNTLNVVASERQKCRILEGYKVLIDGICYQIVVEE